MNRRVAAVSAAAVVLAGAMTAIVPQHAASVSRVLAVAVATVAGGLVLGAVGRFVTQDPPRTALDVPPTAGAPPLEPHGLRDARRDLAGPAMPGSLPTPVWKRLVVLAELRSQRLGVDHTDPGSRAAIEARLRPETWKGLTTRRSDPAAVAATVHRTLDELSLLDAPIGAGHGSR